MPSTAECEGKTFYFISDAELSATSVIIERVSAFKTEKI